MEVRPQIKFARASGSTIAYMTYGDKDVTVCAIPPMAQNMEMAWEAPEFRYLFEGFAEFSRQVAFDKRGTGMSDRSLDIPAIDERVDELRAVMDQEGIDHAYLHGLSEGGPMAIMFAATYPHRVDGLILEATGARLSLGRDATEDELAIEQAGRQMFIDAWGTPESITLQLFAPSLVTNEEFATWWQKYERNAANRDALGPLFDMMGEMDAREALGQISCPVLVLHRRDDQMVSFELGVEAYELLRSHGADVEMVELEGNDHFSFAGDVDATIREVERFVTGKVSERPTRSVGRVEIRTLGGFEVLIGGVPVPTKTWGSKRARVLLQRLVVAQGWPVTRDELIEMLWPDDASDRLSSRLSVQLSAVRRVLGGAVIADRSTVRLDTDAVEVDLMAWLALVQPGEIVEQFGGPFLPEAQYDDWSAATRLEVHSRYGDAVHRLAAAGQEDRETSAILIKGLGQLLAIEPYGEQAHRELIDALATTGQLNAARQAHATYAAAMAELDITVVPFDDL